MSSSSRINGLLKFERPVLVNEALSNTTKKSSSIKKNGNGIQPLSADAEATPSQTEEILATILPPRKWEDKMGKLWTQTVSSSPATRIEVIKLQQELDKLMVKRKAKETGICPVRRELYDELFDELIRQVTLNCVERGLLLLSVRDEIRMTMEAYKTLYDSSIAFGIRKALLSEQGKKELVEKIEQLEKKNSELEKNIKENEIRYEEEKKKEAENNKMEMSKLNEELKYLKEQNKRYQNELARLCATNT